MQNLAEIKLWGQQVGALAYDPETGLSSFEYARSWVEQGIELSPLHMPIAALSGQDNSYQRLFRFPQLANPTYKGLPAAFADTLPDDFGNAVINAWLARSGRDPASFTALERLLYTGNRGMGALEYAPAIERLGAAQNVELESLVAMAQEVLDQRSRLESDIDANVDGLQAILQVGTSAGGARPKAVVALDKSRRQIRSGQLQAPAGYEHFLLKFDGVVERGQGNEVFGDPQGYGRMEYAYYLMARDAGIQMSHCELLADGDRAHFITKRFDRVGDNKLHYQSLCAMDHADYKQPGSYSYEQLLGVARRLRLSRADAVEIFRRLVFNVVARNHDDHSKNFGFVLADKNAQWQLAPAFDVAYSYKPGSPWVNSHQLSVNGKRDNFNHEDLMAVAGLIGNFSKQASLIIDEVSTVVSQWGQYADKAGVFLPLRDEIQSALRLNLGAK